MEDKYAGTTWLIKILKGIGVAGCLFGVKSPVLTLHKALQHQIAEWGQMSHREKLGDDGATLKLTATHVFRFLTSCRRGQSISKIPSTSTATPRGSEGALTANRACCPAGSPKTSTIRSDVPLMTLG